MTEHSLEEKARQKVKQVASFLLSNFALPSFLGNVILLETMQFHSICFTQTKIYPSPLGFSQLYCFVFSPRKELLQTYHHHNRDCLHQEVWYFLSRKEQHYNDHVSLRHSLWVFSLQTRVMPWFSLRVCVRSGWCITLFLVVLMQMCFILRRRLLCKLFLPIPSPP